MLVGRRAAKEKLRNAATTAYLCFLKMTVPFKYYHTPLTAHRFIPAYIEVVVVVEVNY